ncbi:hypothetical protein PAMP_004202 [Pampus punctatissimus]
MMHVAHILVFVILAVHRHPSVSDATVVLNVNSTASESVVLPCALNRSSIILKDLCFYWQDERKAVLYSFNGEEMPEHVSKVYQDRITAFHHDMTRGNISVKLKDPKLEDTQRVFSVYVLNRKMKSLTHICQITLHVAVPYMTISLVVNEEAMTAVCTTQRGFPEPRVSWRLRHLNSTHRLEVRDAHTTAVQDAGNHLYNTSSTIDIRGGRYRELTCLIYNPTTDVTLYKTHVFNKDKHMCSLPGWAVLLTAALLVTR